MSPYKNFKKYNRGFSLVEIMVGMVISLLSMIIILQVFSAFEGQKRTSTSGSDAQTNGSIALFTIERNMRNAGYGFSVPEALGCTIRSFYNGARQADFSLQPVVITNGAGGAPDTIRMLASTKGWATPAQITSNLPRTSVVYDLDTTFGIEENDFMIAFEPGVTTCTLLQVTNIPSGASKIQRQGGNNSLWNPNGSTDVAAIYPSGNYSDKGMLFNLGQRIQLTYSLSEINNDLQVAEFSTGPAGLVTTTTVPLIPDIVNLQAQYGFDDRVGIQTTAQVTRWEDAMFDADRDGAIGAGDIARIYAVRIAVVTRSGQQERGVDNTGACNTTPASPTWANNELAIDISKKPGGAANPDWKCYRYKTFETVIPLRNLIWRQT